MCIYCHQIIYGSVGAFCIFLEKKKKKTAQILIFLRKQWRCFHWIYVTCQMLSRCAAILCFKIGDVRLLRSIPATRRTLYSSELIQPCETPTHTPQPQLLASTPHCPGTLNKSCPLPALGLPIHGMGRADSSRQLTLVQDDCDG